MEEVPQDGTGQGSNGVAPDLGDNVEETETGTIKIGRELYENLRLDNVFMGSITVVYPGSLYEAKVRLSLEMTRADVEKLLDMKDLVNRGLVRILVEPVEFQIPLKEGTATLEGIDYGPGSH